MIRIRTVDQLPIEGSRVFYRVDYNVPLEGSAISDATRIEETLPTLRLMRERDASIVIASHLGRPKGQRNEKYSLKPVRDKLKELIGADVQWADDCVGAEAEQKASQLKLGQLLLLENLRFHAEEEKNDRRFAAGLKKLAEFYVNDAFGASHRAHASIDALPRLFPRDHTAGGLLLAKEIEFLQKVTDIKVNAEAPFQCPVTAEEWPKFWKHGEWNELRARIEGNPPKITTWVKGVKFMEYTDTEKRLADKGGIALQVHGGGDSTKQFVRYRHIRVKELGKK